MAPSKPAKRWILAPTRDLSPTNSPIALGAIITSAESADRPLHTPAPPAPEAAISTHDARDWTLNLDRARSGRVGVWTSFCQVVLGDADASWARRLRERWDVRRMRTLTFAPPPGFVERAVQAAAVREYVVRNRFRRKVYMVTGVKIASGVRGFAESVRERSWEVRMGVDGTVLGGVPLAAGPQGAVGEQGREKVGFGDADDLVFAFSLREIRVRRSTGEVVRQRQFRDGDFMGLDDVNQVEERDIADEEDFVTLGLAGNDAGGDDLDLEEVGALEDENGEECVCVKPEL